jgi:hypothetical protein
MAVSSDTFAEPTPRANLPPRYPWCVWITLVPWFDATHWRCISCGRCWAVDGDGVHPPFHVPPVRNAPAAGRAA